MNNKIDEAIECTKGSKKYDLHYFDISVDDRANAPYEGLTYITIHLKNLFEKHNDYNLVFKLKSSQYLGECLSIFIDTCYFHLKEMHNIEDCKTELLRKFRDPKINKNLFKMLP